MWKLTHEGHMHEAECVLLLTTLPLTAAVLATLRLKPVVEKAEALGATTATTAAITEAVNFMV